MALKGFRNVAAVAIAKDVEKEKKTIRDSIGAGRYSTDTLLVDMEGASVELEYLTDTLTIRQYRSACVRHTAVTKVGEGQFKRTPSAFPTVAVLAELVAALHCEAGHEVADAHLRRIARICAPMADNGTGVSDTGPSPAFVGIESARKAAQDERPFAPLRSIAAATVKLWDAVTAPTERWNRGRVSVAGGFEPLSPTGGDKGVEFCAMARNAVLPR
jgi:hypothetical protein